MKNLMNLFAIALLFFVTSCQKEEIAPQTYPENPYNYVGENHNEMVGTFLTNHADQLLTIQSPMEKEVYIFDNILTENNLDFKNYRDAKDLLEIQSTQILNDFDFTQFEKIFAETEMTETGRTTLVNALQELIKIDGTTPQGFADVQKEIRDIEITFIKDYEGTNDYRPALTFLAVLKKSGEFWTDNPNGDIPTKAKWWQTLLADAAGAVIGGALGGGTAVPLAAGFSLAVNNS